MSSPTQSQQSKITLEQATSALEQVIAATEAHGAGKIVDRFFEDHIGQLEAVLPPKLKNQARRLVKRARLYMQKVPKLQQCTPGSLIVAILQAAELGLVIDGKLAYAVPYNCKIKEGKKERWELQAQFQAGYLGLIAVAKRSRVLADVYADLVRHGDHFKHGKRDGKCFLEHSYGVETKRGDVTGAYAIFKLPSGLWHYELMQIEEINKIKARSKSRDKEGNIVGPWVTDEGEMQKKTVLRRGLKPFSFDLEIALALGSDDDEVFVADDGDRSVSGELPTGRVTLPRNGTAKQELPPTATGEEHTEEGGTPEEPEREPGSDDEPRLFEQPAAAGAQSKSRSF
jgi:recombination protein RecT